MGDRGGRSSGGRPGGDYRRGGGDDRRGGGSGGGGGGRPDMKRDRGEPDSGGRSRYSGGGGGRDRSPRKDSPSRGGKGFGGGGFGREQHDNKPGPEALADLPKKKFTGRCRLFVGNLDSGMKEAELKALFEPFGEISECFLSGKGFAFLRMDTRAHAESAKEDVDGKVVRNRPIRVRFAVHGASLRIKELSPYVSNELLFQAFSNFGEVERAVHIVDEKGRPTGEGIVEFERKPAANEAIRQCKDNVFLLTANPKPLRIEQLDPRDEDDGLSERMIPRTGMFVKEREMGPRFASPGSFEQSFGQRWKELYEMEKVKREQLEGELKEARERLESDMELAYQDYQTQLLREDLERRQRELDRLEAAKRDRMEMHRRREEAMGGGMHHAGQRMGGMQRPDDMPNYFGGGDGGGPPFPPQGGGGDFRRGGGPEQQQFGGGPGQSMFLPRPDDLPPVPSAFGEGLPPPPVAYGGPSGSSGGQSLLDALGGGGGPPSQFTQQGQVGGPPQGRPDPNLVQGVQKLLQMFKGGPGGGAPPTSLAGPPLMTQGGPGGNGHMADMGQPGGPIPGMFGMMPPQGFPQQQGGGAGPDSGPPGKQRRRH